MHASVQLVLPLLLLSKVTLFNTRIAPAASDIMDEAGRLVTLMERLVMSVETGAKGKTARAKDATFGHLFFVFRDFELEVDDLSSAVAKREKVTASNMRRLGDMVRDYSLCLGDVSVPSVKKRWEKMRPDEHGFNLTAKKVKEMEMLRTSLRSKFASIQGMLLDTGV
ncbi:MAG: hypothetical protein EOO65_03835 [Methanosarcinales archaeon]|nr:MAG: hypothetical protein EOO65_03835 [Methanosarcinales archaeon]